MEGHEPRTDVVLKLEALFGDFTEESPMIWRLCMRGWTGWSCLKRTLKDIETTARMENLRALMTKVRAKIEAKTTREELRR